MRLLTWRLLGCAMLVAALGALVTAQTQRTPEPDVLGALLVEVRGLRQAMEQMAAAGPRVQLALGRLQLQEQRINTMLRRLESVRDSIASVSREEAQFQQQIAQHQDAIRDADTQPAQERERFIRASTYEMGELKKRMEPITTELQRLRGEEGTLEQQIGAEQARWSDINRSLEELEGALGRR